MYCTFLLAPDESGLSQKRYPKKAPAIPARPVKRGYTASRLGRDGKEM